MFDFNTLAYRSSYTERNTCSGLPWRIERDLAAKFQFRRTGMNLNLLISKILISQGQVHWHHICVIILRIFTVRSLYYLY